MDAYSPGDWMLAAIGLSACSFFLGRWFGIAVTLSISMLMVLFAWLQWINFDGSWPSNQPRNDNYFISKEKESKLELTALRDNSMSKSDWKDFHRCKKYNVCVRKFQSFAEPRSKND